MSTTRPLTQESQRPRPGVDGRELGGGDGRKDSEAGTVGALAGRAQSVLSGISECLLAGVDVSVTDVQPESRRRPVWSWFRGSSCWAESFLPNCLLRRARPRGRVDGARAREAVCPGPRAGPHASCPPGGSEEGGAVGSRSPPRSEDPDSLWFSHQNAGAQAHFPHQKDKGLGLIPCDRTAGRQR